MTYDWKPVRFLYSVKLTWILQAKMVVDVIEKNELYTKKNDFVLKRPSLTQKWEIITINVKLTKLDAIYWLYFQFQAPSNLSGRVWKML